MMNAVIFSRKAAIDQFTEGLCEMQFLQMLQQFPEMFKPIFVRSSKSDGLCHDQLVPSVLKKMIVFEENTDETCCRWFTQYVNSLDMQGTCTSVT